MSKFPQTPDNFLSQDVAKLAEIIKDIKVCMFTTIDPSGSMISRPMAALRVDADGDLWFVSDTNARKVNHVRDQSHVNVAFSSAKSWVSVAGDAEIIRDVEKTKELWNAGVSAWFPDGPEAPGIVLVKVSARSGEYWDTPGVRTTSLLSFVKAKVTGESYDVDNQTVKL